MTLPDGIRVSTVTNSLYNDEIDEQGHASVSL